MPPILKLVLASDLGVQVVEHLIIYDSPGRFSALPPHQQKSPSYRQGQSCK